MDDAPLLLDVTRLIWRRWAGRQETGVDRVCLAYLRHFGARAQAVVQHRRFRRILDRQASETLFRLLEAPSRSFRYDLLRAALRQLPLRACRGRGRLYLNIGHTGLDSEGFRTWLGSAAVRPVYFIHDLIPITSPAYCRSGEDSRHRKRIATALLTGAGIIANSQATLDELARFADAEGLPRPPAIAAWLGCTEAQHVPAAPIPERPTFVMLGTIEARKNHALLLDIWAEFAARMGADAPRLLIIGQRGWEADEVFRRLDGDAALRGHVVELNGCSDVEVAGHLASARALLFPSFAEGFGLPLVEALASGTPVIASDVPVFREIGQGVPQLIDTKNRSAWEAAIAEYALPTSRERAAQVERMSAFRAPSWSDHFELVDDWLSSLPEARGAQ